MSIFILRTKPLRTFTDTQVRENFKYEPMATDLVSCLEVLRQHVDVERCGSANVSLVNKIMQTAMNDRARDWRSIVSNSASVTITLGQECGQVCPVVAVDGEFLRSAYVPA